MRNYRKGQKGGPLMHRAIVWDGRATRSTHPACTQSCCCSQAAAQPREPCSGPASSLQPASLVRPEQRLMFSFPTLPRAPPRLSCSRSCRGQGARGRGRAGGGRLPVAQVCLSHQASLQRWNTTTRHVVVGPEAGRPHSGVSVAASALSRARRLRGGGSVAAPPPTPHRRPLPSPAPGSRCARRGSDGTEPSQSEPEPERASGVSSPVCTVEGGPSVAAAMPFPCDK